jgi:hypothetical protein
MHGRAYVACDYVRAGGGQRLCDRGFPWLHRYGLSLKLGRAGLPGAAFSLHATGMDRRNITKLRPAAPMSSTERSRLFRQRLKQRNAMATPGANEVVAEISTAEICALAARIRDGDASATDRRLADRLLVAFAGQYPRDSIVRLVAPPVADDGDTATTVQR